MEATPAPDPFLARLDEALVNCLLLPLMLGDLGGHALERRHPQMPQLLADIEEVSGLTRRDMDALSACTNERSLIAREYVLRPARLHAFMALGMALWNSPLRDSPFLRFLDDVEGSETGLPDQTAEWVFGVMENNEDRQWVDFPADFEPSPAFIALFRGAVEAESDRAATLAFAKSLPKELITRTSEELRWRRLQLESVVGRAGELLRDLGEAERLLRAPNNPSTDDADADPDLHDYYHGECVELEVKPLIGSMLEIGLLTAQNWHFYGTLPFARAACQLRWLRRQEAVEALRQRVEALEYPAPDDMATGVVCDFSLAELLTIYQAIESLALVAINDLLPTITALRAQDVPAGGDSSFPMATGVLTDVLDVSSPFGKFFYRNVPAFAQFLEDQLTTDDDREELAQARAEIGALAELATSEGAA